jgi:oxygen-independent coproporphyrinogen-3 oxidase
LRALDEGLQALRVSLAVGALRCAVRRLLSHMDMQLEDLKRFVIDVPRYTSYPTAAEFSTEIGAEAHAKQLLARGAYGDGPVSLYVHLPFCAEVCHFCGCHALVARTPERIERYLRALDRETELVAGLLGDGREVAELHFGGGSPSLLDAPLFSELMASLRRHFILLPSAECSIEADPRTTDREKLETYRREGLNRISFGFQDLDDEVQRAIGRNQSAAVSRAAYEAAREVGFSGINIDLCYGLPEQSRATFAATVEAVVAMRPDRVALFGYAHVPWLKPRQKLINASSLPRSELRLQLVADAHARMAAAGYVAVGFDHFALPEDPLARAAVSGTLHRNFQGYTTTRTDALVGLGLSAISDLPEAYAQNARSLRDYYAAVDEGKLPTERGVRRSDDDRLRGDLIRRIMCEFRLHIPAIEAAHELRFSEAFADELAELRRLEDDGLVSVSRDSIDLTPLGRLFVRNVAVVFDAHRRKAPVAAPKRFSASV